MLFKAVAQTFAAIEAISERLQIAAKLSQLLATATSKEATIIVNLSLGQLYPVYKPTQFLIGEKVMIGILAQFFSLSNEKYKKKLIDYPMFLHYFQNQRDASMENLPLLTFSRNLSN
jgi:hypothetical protein